MNLLILVSCKVGKTQTIKTLITALLHFTSYDRDKSQFQHIFSAYSINFIAHLLSWMNLEHFRVVVHLNTFLFSFFLISNILKSVEIFCAMSFVKWNENETTQSCSRLKLSEDGKAINIVGYRASVLLSRHVHVCVCVCVIETFIIMQTETASNGSGIWNGNIYYIHWFFAQTHRH